MLMTAGVDGIMSDYPDRVVAAMKKEVGSSAG
jgi:glycerophosphoryl diester phosphodiesterase